jgi:hypothetical protein
MDTTPWEALKIVISNNGQSLQSRIFGQYLVSYLSGSGEFNGTTQGRVDPNYREQKRPLLAAVVQIEYGHMGTSFAPLDPINFVYWFEGPKRVDSLRNIMRCCCVTAWAASGYSTFDEAG